MEDIRCPVCKTATSPGQLLLKAEFVKGEIKCPRCGAVLRLESQKDRVNGRTLVTKK